ncbi:hypothetical protein SAMN02745751_03285 [Dethiosulfatibacter aminovorans DSM 17477]|uniref:Uncharacterized protein n=1 Tax=Dethiosulfatibacter aminovorans DSM 17477 TaxID=1121476 RepID=A0A1M6LUU4_9FIRM|nr:hypothetical protein SAMN02745751_03285 [Dethiosulfatibacter aminovorans DSM 17477]
MNNQPLETLASKPQNTIIAGGTQVDSALTDLIIEIIISNFNKIEQNSEDN